MSLVKKFATVASGTLMSRIFGFTREMFMAAALGTGPVADAFNAAFRFPNTFRRLFAEGAFNAAFVPLFAKEIEKNGMEGARRFSEEVFGVLFTVLLFITIAMELSMPFIVRTVIAPGFTDDPVKFDNTVRLAIIMFPYLACMSLAAMMGGMLNSLHRYFAAAIAPIFLNIILIGVLAFAWWKGYDALAVGYGLSWGVMAAGLVQLAIVWIAVRNAGIKIGFRRPRLTTHVPRLLLLALPAAIGLGTPWSDMTETGDSYRTNEWLDNVLVSYSGYLTPAAKLYAAGRDLKDPQLSPIYGDFAGLPPAILVTGTRDLFLSNTVRTHRKLRAAGIEASLQVFEGMSHAQYLFTPDSPETREVFGEMAHFFDDHLGR